MFPNARRDNILITDDVDVAWEVTSVHKRQLTGKREAFPGTLG